MTQRYRGRPGGAGRTAGSTRSGGSDGTSTRSETGRTSWSVAGCNKPARSCTEQTVEAGRNGKGGSRAKGGIFALTGGQLPGNREMRTCDADADGEAIFGKPHERSFGSPAVVTQGGRYEAARIEGEIGL